MNSNPQTQYMLMLSLSIPWYLLMLVGLAVCSTRLSSRPRQMLIVGGAIGLVIFDRLGVSFLLNQLLRFAPNLYQPVSGDQPPILFLVFSAFSSTIHAIALGLILYATFGSVRWPKPVYLVEENSGNQSRECTPNDQL